MCSPPSILDDFSAGIQPAKLNPPLGSYDKQHEDSLAEGLVFGFDCQREEFALFTCLLWACEEEVLFYSPTVDLKYLKDVKQTAKTSCWLCVAVKWSYESSLQEKKTYWNAQNLSKNPVKRTTCILYVCADPIELFQRLLTELLSEVHYMSVISLRVLHNQYCGAHFVQLSLCLLLQLVRKNIRDLWMKMFSVGCTVVHLVNRCTLWILLLSKLVYIFQPCGKLSMCSVYSIKYLRPHTRIQSGSRMMISLSSTTEGISLSVSLLKLQDCLAVPLRLTY